jgi:hypothetical protein
MIHKGVVWSFTVPAYLIVDEFETYTDVDGERIYQTWIDGWTNGTGSIVGNLAAPFAEQTIITGRQSMPMDHNNIKSPNRARRNWTSRRCRIGRLAT